MKTPGSFAGSVLVLAVLGTGALHPEEPSAELPAAVARGWDEVSEWLTGEMKTQGVVGASIYLTHGGQTVRRLHFGLAEREEGRPVDGETIFHWGSITKTLTAVAVMQLRAWSPSSTPTTPLWKTARTSTHSAWR